MEQDNDPHHDGEYWLLAQMLNLSTGRVVVLDVGAHVGNWSAQAMALADQTGKAIELYAFEPASATRRILERNLQPRAGFEISPLALSSAAGEAEFFSNAPGSGTNSLSPASGAEKERVLVSTVDMWLEEHGVENVAMMKVDTEGYDFEVLKGAQRAIMQGKFEVIQFEYNWRWLLNRASLLNVFDFIRDKPYRIGKLVSDSIILYDAWHFEMDRYFEGNYVLVRSGGRIEALGRRATFDGCNTTVIE